MLQHPSSPCIPGEFLNEHASGLSEHIFLSRIIVPEWFLHRFETNPQPV